MNMNNLIIEKNGYELNNPNNFESFIALAKRNKMIKQYFTYICDTYNQIYTTKPTYKISRFEDDLYSIEGCIITIPAGKCMEHLVEILTQPIQDACKDVYYNGAIHFLTYNDRLELILG